MNKTNIILFALAGVIAVPAYAAESYTIDHAHTWPMFEVNHLGFSTQRGRFDKTSGKITLDIAAKKGSVDLVIGTDSLNMGFDKWNEHMKSADFFNAAQFPMMHFTSNNLVFEGENVVAAEGSFTLLGVTKPLTLTVSNFRCAPNPMNKKLTCGADISGTLKRSEFGMTKYVPAISDEVKIFSPVEAFKD